MTWKSEVPKELAERMVKLLNEVTGNNIQFMGEGGEIIATTQPHRLGTIHEGARKIMAGEADEAYITEEQAKNIEGVLPGYTGPIEINGKRVGCLAVTGDPAKVMPLQKMAAIILKDEIEKDLDLKRRQQIIDNVSSQIQQVSATVEELSASAEEVAANSKSMEETASRANTDVQKTYEILDVIRKIADQTNLLGLNAAIEAARAGEHGRGFSVVAEEVRKLSNTSSDSVRSVEEILQEIRGVIEEMTKAIFEISKITDQQSQALQDLSESVVKVQDVVAQIATND